MHVIDQVHRLRQQGEPSFSASRMDRTAANLEKEITDIVKRADKSPDKTGSQVNSFAPFAQKFNLRHQQRRDALRRLIDLTHAPQPNLKTFAAVNIRNYFNDFPELEDAAIDAIYDLCEDQDSKVPGNLLQ